MAMNQNCLLGGLPDVTDFLVSVIREICDSDNRRHRMRVWYLVGRDREVART